MKLRRNILDIKILICTTSHEYTCQGDWALITKTQMLMDTITYTEGFCKLKALYKAQNEILIVLKKHTGFSSLSLSSNTYACKQCKTQS